MRTLGAGVGLFDIEFQIGSLSEIAFVFVNASGEPVEIESWTFEFFVKTNAGDRVKQISKTLGSGLSFPIYETNEVDLSFTDNTIAEGEYVWELRRTDINKPLLAGNCFFSFNPKQGDTEITTQIINDTLTVEVTISGSGGSGSSGFAAELDASLGAFPAGSFNEAAQVKVINGGLIDGVYCQAGSILIAMQDSPTSDWDALTGWKLI